MPHTVKILEIEPVTHNVRRFRFEKPEGFDFAPGQATEVSIDKDGWREDAKAFLEAARRLNLPAALERSRSGRGAHVWLFFE